MRQTAVELVENNSLLRQQLELEVYYSTVYDNHLSNYLVNQVQRVEIDATHSSWTHDSEARKQIAALITKGNQSMPINVSSL